MNGLMSDNCKTKARLRQVHDSGIEAHHYCINLVLYIFCNNCNNNFCMLVCYRVEMVIGSDKWLNAHYDPVAGLCTFSQCVVFSDINADGDCKLIIADLGCSTGNIKLKVYRGKNASLL